MNEHNLVAETLDRLLRDHPADLTDRTAGSRRPSGAAGPGRPGGIDRPDGTHGLDGSGCQAGQAFDEALWDALDTAGFTRVGVPEAAGGAGGSADIAHVVLDRLGAGAACVPVAETLVAGWLCARAGLVLPPGPCTFGPARPADLVAVERGRDGVALQGTLHRVPWAGSAGHIVVVAPYGSDVAVALVDRDRVVVRPGRNVAGEPRDDVDLVGIALDPAQVGIVPEHHGGDDGLVLGAIVRAVGTAGALRRTVELTRDHVADRVQFGRALVSFQLVRQQLAELAGEVAAASVAARTALPPIGDSPDEVAVAAAKIRTARAAGVVAATAHQLHGAIGFTDEHPLHRLTTRLWAWRDELGTQGWWEERLGAAVARAGADALWDCVAGARSVPAGRR